MADPTNPPRLPLLIAQTELLAQLRALIQAVDEPQYLAADRRVPGATFGRQVRHCLDHFLQFFSGLDQGVIDYGARQREDQLERSPEDALACLDKIEAQLAQLQLSRQSLRVRLDDGALVPTSAARELEFLNSHTVHHLALLALLARDWGIEVPDRVGVAFSTLAHRRAVQT